MFTLIQLEKIYFYDKKLACVLELFSLFYLTILIYDIISDSEFSTNSELFTFSDIRISMFAKYQWTVHSFLDESNS